jgi:hypothetical protein
MKSSDLMHPQIDGYSPIFRKYHGIVLFFNNCTSLVREFQRLGEGAETNAGSGHEKGDECVKVD